MITTEEVLIELKNFSELFNLTPPWSNNISIWWHQVISEMEEWLLYLIHDNNIFAYSDNSKIKWMNDVLLQRIKELEAVYEWFETLSRIWECFISVRNSYFLAFLLFANLSANFMVFFIDDNKSSLSSWSKSSIVWLPMWI